MHSPVTGPQVKHGAGLVTASSSGGPSTLRSRAPMQPRVVTQVLQPAHRSGDAWSVALDGTGVSLVTLEPCSNISGDRASGPLPSHMTAGAPVLARTRIHGDPAHRAVVGTPTPGHHADMTVDLTHLGPCPIDPTQASRRPGRSRAGIRAPSHRSRPASPNTRWSCGCGSQGRSCVACHACWPWRDQGSIRRSSFGLAIIGSNVDRLVIRDRHRW
jgi:hypothetical protein